MTAVAGRRTPASAELGEGQWTRPGDFQFESRGRSPSDDPCPDGDWGRLSYNCPRTGQPCGDIIIGKSVKPDVGSSSWNWDGDLDRPTLEPSINCRGGCGWHGWLKAGVFVD